MRKASERVLIPMTSIARVHRVYLVISLQRRGSQLRVVLFIADGHVALKKSGTVAHYFCLQIRVSANASCCSEPGFLLADTAAQLLIGKRSVIHRPSFVSGAAVTRGL